VEFLFTDFDNGRFQFLAYITAIGKDMAQPWIAVTDGSYNGGSAIPTLNIGRWWPATQNKLARSLTLMLE